MNNQRGMSDIVVTVIMIVLVLVAVGVVWTIVQNILSQSTDDISLGALKISLNIEKVKVTNEGVDVQVKRNAGEANLIGINFIISDGVDTQTFEEETTMNELATKTFNIPYNGFVKSVEIAPILESEAGNKKIGNVVDKETFGPFKSCLELFNQGVNEDGIYIVNPQGEEFEVYCDMTTDGGGWTLVLAGGNFQFGKSDGFWDGTGDTNQEFTYEGNTFNTQNSKKIIKNMAFTEMKFSAYNKRGIFRSAVSSTFVQKKSAQTPWTKIGGDLDSLSWNINDEDGYSRGEFLLGTRMDFDCGQGVPSCYGDYYWYYLGGNVHSVGSGYGHWFNWVGESDDCGLPSAGCPDASHIRYYAIGYNTHRASYSFSTDALFFR